MVILRTQNKITDFFMILAWASPFNVWCQAWCGVVELSRVLCNICLPRNIYPSRTPDTNLTQIQTIRRIKAAHVLAHACCYCFRFTLLAVILHPEKYCRLRFGKLFSPKRLQIENAI